MRQAIADKLLPLLEAYGDSRLRQRDLRRAMKAAICRAPEAEDMRQALAQGLVEAGRVAPCYDPLEGRTPWCEACREHDALYARLAAERKGQKARLLKINRLAMVLARPEPPPPPEPRALIDLIESLEPKP
jgi:hypothetical protein